jgi:hypothetical protein
MNPTFERTTEGFHKQPGPIVGSAPLAAVIAAVTALLLTLALVGAGTCW